MNIYIILVSAMMSHYFKFSPYVRVIISPSSNLLHRKCLIHRFFCIYSQIFDSLIKNVFWLLSFNVFAIVMTNHCVIREDIFFNCFLVVLFKTNVGSNFFTTVLSCLPSHKNFQLKQRFKNQR